MAINIDILNEYFDVLRKGWLESHEGEFFCRQVLSHVTNL
jgi:hypothetical protein